MIHGVSKMTPESHRWRSSSFVIEHSVPAVPDLSPVSHFNFIIHSKN